jgi:hypothetical protein
LLVFSDCSTPASPVKKLRSRLGEADLIFISLQDKKSIWMIYHLKRRNNFKELLLPGH